VNQRRIIYILEPFSTPFGGVATIYKHVELLAANGFPAYVLIREKPKVDFYQTTVPYLFGPIEPLASDICVVPESFPDILRALKSTPAKRIMFCQSLIYLPFTEDPGDGIAEFGVHRIVVCSHALQNFFRDVYGVADLPLLPCAVDPKLFVPTAHKRRQIALMPRRLPEDAKFIEATFKRRYPHYADIPWVPITGATQSAAAQVLGQSAVFLSLSSRESFGLPPLEAMSCGCLVAGYHGDGGREYMTAENGWWAEQGDWRGCGDGLAAAIAVFDEGGPELESRRRAATETVARYSPDRLEAALTAFWGAELAEPFP